MGRKRAGAPPLDPTFYSRSLPLAGFWDRYPWYDSGTTSSGMLRPIWDAFSSKKYAEKAFCKRKSPNQGTYMGLVIAHRPKQCTTTAKTSEWERAALKTGGRGHPPATLCVRAFSRESLDPPPGTGREPTSQVLTCAGLEGTTYRAPKAKGERQRRSPFIRCRGTITVPHPRRTA